MNNNQYQKPTPNYEISSKALFDFQQKLNDYRDNFGEPNEETSLAATAAASLIITTSYVIIIKKEGVSMK